MYTLRRHRPLRHTLPGEEKRGKSANGGKKETGRSNARSFASVVNAGPLMDLTVRPVLNEKNNKNNIYDNEDDDDEDDEEGTTEQAQDNQNDQTNDKSPSCAQPHG